MVNPFEETMMAGRAGMNVPERARNLNTPYHQQEEYNKFQMRANEPEARALASKVTRGFMDQGYNFPRFTPHRTPAWTTEAAGVSPGGGNSRTWSRPEQWNYGVTPGERSGMDSGEFLSSRYGGGIDDAAGMNDDAMGMIEGAGFEVASSPGMVDERMDKKLWGIAVNKFPPGSPDMMIQQEWERLKQIYRDKKYGVDTGLELPSRDDIVGLS